MPLPVLLLAAFFDSSRPWFERTIKRESSLWVDVTARPDQYSHSRQAFCRQMIIYRQVAPPCPSPRCEELPRPFPGGSKDQCRSRQAAGHSRWPSAVVLYVLVPTLHCQMCYHFSLTSIRWILFPLVARLFFLCTISADDSLTNPSLTLSFPSWLHPCIHSDQPILDWRELLPRGNHDDFTNCKSSLESSHLRLESGNIYLTSYHCFYSPFTVRYRLGITCNDDVTEFDVWAVIQHAKFPQTVPTASANLEFPQSLLPLSSKSKRALSNGDHPNGITFDQELYTVNVTEGQVSPVRVLTVQATNIDRLPLFYNILAAQDARSMQMFKIDRITGDIDAVVILDRELITKHVLRVSAYEAGSPSRTALASVIINVIDTNDHKPIFEKSVYVAAISEGTEIGTTVLHVHAQDNDEGENGDVEYTLDSEDDDHNRGQFSIDPVTGVLKTRRFLDRENRDFYRLKVNACDRSPTDPHCSNALIEVSIDDENDNCPKFDQGKYRVEIKEDIDPSSKPVIAKITAIDGDAGENGKVHYSIVSGNTANKFAIGYENGQVRLLGKLNYKEASQYELVVRAQDGGQLPLSNTTFLIVSVLDVNDHQPQFYHPSTSAVIREDASVGSFVTNVQAYDGDSGENADIRYTLVLDSEEKDFPFELNESTGTIRVKASLDRESVPMYDFQVVATDRGRPPLSSSVRVVVQVSDVNDNAPTFERKIYNISILENIPHGSQILRLSAFDPDEASSRLEYTISAGNEDKKFLLVNQGDSGELTMNGKLDYKHRSIYSLSIKATDTGGRHDTSTVYVYVQDVNSAPFFTDHPFIVRVYENEPIGSTVAVVQASDNDHGQYAHLTYTMDGDRAYYRIDPQTGVIYVNQSIDRETYPRFDLRITATDDGDPPLSASTHLEVVVDDVNDNAPVFQHQNYTTVISEDTPIGTSFFQVVATDSDADINGRIVYSIRNNEAWDSPFYIDASSGIIRVQKALDRETVPEYHLTVLAEDKGTPSFTGTSLVHITLSDVNDNAPRFTDAGKEDTLHYYVRENSPVGTKVAHLVAVDPDEGTNAKITYKIFGGPDMASFDLLSTSDGDQGIDLLTRTRMDYESKKSVYQLQLQAISGDLSSVVDVYVHVLDVNDHRPELNDFYVIFNNYEDHFPLSHPGRVPAYDPDVNDTLTYRILEGNEGSLLHLDEKTGQLTLGANLNTNRQIDARMKICVTDGPNEACAICRLRTIFVTEEMLLNSVTIRARQANVHAFLNPLAYNRFLDTLATLLPSKQDDVFIFSVVDDEDVLNISFSIRRPGQDQFVSSGELQELVYLNHKTLKSASHLDILPFEDNLCVREPCLNYERCQMVLKFGQAPDFITTDTFLFRPVHPVNTFVCLCPKGFAGMNAEYMCDTEVNLCYSSPCGANGTCVPKEGSYVCVCPPNSTGPNCEYPLDNEFCLPELCGGGSQCRVNNHQFQCQNCPYPPEFTTEYCQLTSRSFNKRAYVTLAPIKARNRFEISLRFATIDPNGVLFYNGRYHPHGDFLALTLQNGRLKFDFSVGDEKASTATFHQETTPSLADGKWHSVVVSYNNRTVTVAYDNCDPSLALLHSMDIDYPRCAVRSTYELDEKCSNPTVSCYRFLDLTSPFYVGGLPRDDDRRQFRVNAENFDGCIKDLIIDGRAVDFDQVLSDIGTESGCTALSEVSCSGSPCRNDGKCRSSWGGHVCECGSQYGGRNCTDEITPPRRLLAADSKIIYSIPAAYPFPFAMGLSFRTRRNDFSALTATITNDRMISIALKSGRLFVVYGSDHCDILYHQSLAGGHWHSVAILVAENHLNATIDFVFTKTCLLKESFYGGISEIFVGGGTQILPTCVKGAFVGRSLHAPEYLKIESEVHTDLGCTVPRPCSSNPCPSSSICVENWNSFNCICQPGYLKSRDGCLDICSAVNPCRNGGRCRKAINGYQCQCRDGYSGRHCEEKASPASGKCPKNWWGYPFCTPCNCPAKKGYKSDCDKKNGQCKCKTVHYLNSSIGHCLPCECHYPIGALNATCDYDTGRCHCRGNIIGRRCDTCSDRNAQIDRSVGRCKAITDACPESFDEGILWPMTFYGSTAYRPCPKGFIGTASRKCNSKEELWTQANLFNCSSLDFESLRNVLTKLDNNLDLSPYLAKRIAAELRNATEARRDRLYGGDLYVAYRLLLTVLRRELNQPNIGGAPYSHVHDKRFVENIIHCCSVIISPHYFYWWKGMDGGQEPIVLLMQSLHDYGVLLAGNHLSGFTRPFRLRAENIYFSVDTVRSGGFELPKYDNFVYDGAQDGFGTRVAFSGSKKSFNWHVFYASFGSLARLMNGKGNEKMKRKRSSAAMINTPIVSMAIFDSSGSPVRSLLKPFLISFPWLNNKRRTKPHCVSWQQNEKSGGTWQKSGCAQVTVNETHVVCECNHLSIFAVMVGMDIVTALSYDDSIHDWLSNYVTIAVTALSVILLTIVSLHSCCCRENWFHRSNIQSILKSVVACSCLEAVTFLFTEMAYESETICRAVGGILQFAYASLFTWSMLYLVHMYLMVTEIKDVDSGISWIYALLGWGLPLVPIGITASMSPSSWRRNRACWYDCTDPYMWSMAGPIGLTVLISVFIFVLCATIGYSKEWRVLTSKFNFRGQLVSILIVQCLVICQWILALLVLNWRIAFLYYFYDLITFVATSVLLYMIVRQNSSQSEIGEHVQGRTNWWRTCLCCRQRVKKEMEESSKIGRCAPEDPSATVSRPESPLQGFHLRQAAHNDKIYSPVSRPLNGTNDDEESDDDDHQENRPFAAVHHSTPPMTALRPTPSILASSPAPHIRLNSFNSPAGSCEDFSIGAGCHTPQSMVNDILTLRRPMKPDLIPSLDPSATVAGGYATIRKTFTNGRSINKPILSPVQKVLSDSEEESPIMKRFQKRDRFQSFVSSVGYSTVPTADQESRYREHAHDIYR